MVLVRHRRGLDHGSSEIARQQPQSTVTAERIGHRPQHVQIAARLGRRTPGQSAAIEPWFHRVGTQAPAHDSEGVAVQESAASNSRIRNAMPPAVWKRLTSALPFG